MPVSDPYRDRGNRSVKASGLGGRGLEQPLLHPRVLRLKSLTYLARGDKEPSAQLSLSRSLPS